MALHPQQLPAVELQAPPGVHVVAEEISANGGDSHPMIHLLSISFWIPCLVLQAPINMLLGQNPLPDVVGHQDRRPRR